MKKQILITFSILFTFGLSGCAETTLNEIDDIRTETNNIKLDEDIDVTIEELSNTDEPHDDYGSLGALDNTTFTIEEMLIYAIQDEYTAKQEYTYIINNFDITKPFTNIIKSEDTHIDLLLPLFEAYGITTIEDTSLDHVVTIDDIEEAFATGVQAEILNIAMYNLFLEQDNLPNDIKDVFIQLRDASENHLDAFQKNLDNF